MRRFLDILGNKVCGIGSSARRGTMRSSDDSRDLSLPPDLVMEMGNLSKASAGRVHSVGSVRGGKVVKRTVQEYEGDKVVVNPLMIRKERRP